MSAPTDPTRPGAVLRDLRVERGLTQVEVAAAAGLSRNYLSQLESGRRGNAVEVWGRICDALGLTSEERGRLLGGAQHEVSGAGVDAPNVEPSPAIAQGDIAKPAGAA